nr:unnamed protein product [Callosobruchus analis]CAI5824220.1 unnamed protein product [Callosobruchus analis]CAI5826491.1 unnamed protein product [Callosobruchus analis]CAI5828252.1 unnamed protein product [Callosobruchus analis]CAI5832144.1 unnamed protein product [Callosobruchus analis]
MDTNCLGRIETAVVVG